MSRSQVVIVTGASRGLGAAIARILAEMGARVIITARSAVPLDALADEVRARGGDVATLAGDISDPVTAQRLVALARDRFGRLDAVVNNAGILEPLARMEHANSDAWRRAFDVNVLGPLLLVREALPDLRETQGRAIHVSSGAAVKAVTGWGAYCVSKAALNHVNLMLAHEEPAITTIAVRPGVVDTAMQGMIRDEGGRAMTASEHARFVNHHDKGELQPPDVPARAIALLALHAPHDWSGEFMRCTDERIAALAH